MNNWEQVYGHLSAALVQSIPSDDQIIIGHIRDACAIAEREMRKERQQTPPSGTPTKPGFYWGKWKIAADGTPEGNEQTPSDEWEVHHVVENTLDPNDEEYLMVEVPGQAKWQPIENFYWGHRVVRAAE